MFVLFSQTPDIETLPSWAQLAGGIVSWGFAVWYAWYTTTKTIPELNSKHTEAISKLVDKFTVESKELRDADRARSERSSQLALEGFKSLSQMTEAVHSLKDSIERLPHNIKGQ